MPRPARSASAGCERASIAATAEPTVPNPARPTLSGSAIGQPIQSNPGGIRLRSAAFGKRNDVVQLFRRAFKEAPDITRGLTDALLVLDQRDPHVSFPILAKADTRRDRHACLLDQERGELDAA